MKKTTIKNRLLSMFIILTMLVSTMSAVYAVPTTQNQNQGDGIILRKSATPHIDEGTGEPDGTVDIVIDAYTTGAVASQATVVPSDIVLVLDVSGSMDDSQEINTYEYTAANGYEYETGYGFRRYRYFGFESGFELFIEDQSRPGKYLALSRNGDDANDYIHYTYYDMAGSPHIVYPYMGEEEATAVENREFDYPVAQFYTRKVTSSVTTEAKIVTMKESVGSFIDQTLAMNNAVADESQMHRIAIVKYAGPRYYSGSGSITNIDNATEAVVGNNTYQEGFNTYNYTQLVKDFTIVNEAGDAELRAAVDDLSAGGATAVDYGIQLAQTTLAERPAEEMAARNEVVIVFSDGQPTHGNSYDPAVAGEGINRALAIKAAGGTVFTLSVLQGANGATLDGDSADDDDRNSNRFMHYVSSNYPAASYASDTITPGEGSVNDGFYMTPNEEQNLLKIFEHIMQQIGKPHISLGEETAVVDTLSQYFDLTDTVTPGSNVKIQTIKKTIDGNGTVSYEYDDPALPGINVDFTTDKRQIKVTGFNFDQNYISTTAREEGFAGRVLRITINVTPNYGTIDAMTTKTNEIPTNLESTPAIVVDPRQVQPIATTLSPTVPFNKVSYFVDGESFADGYYDVYRLPGSDNKLNFEPTEVGKTFSGWATTDATVDTDGKFVMPSGDVDIHGSFTAIDYNVTYKYVSDYSGIGVSTDNLPLDATYNYGDDVTVASVPVDAPAGYTFSGWKSAEVTATTSEQFKMPAQDVTFVAGFTANGDTEFTIQHYLEELDGTFSSEPYEEYTDVGETDTEASAVANAYIGFTYDEAITTANNEDGITVTAEGVSGNIAGDGSLVLKLYYSRNSYNVNYQYDGSAPGDATDISGYGGTYKYGEAVLVEDSSTAEGYDFHGWISEQVNKDADGDALENGNQFYMPAVDVLFEGHFVAHGDTPYKVEHYLQNVDGTYPTEPEKTSNHTGETDSEVTTVPIYFKGFTFDRENPNNKLTDFIDASGEMTLKIYYKRNKHTVSYIYNGIVPADAPALPVAVTYVYGAEVTVAAQPLVNGYSFAGWTDHSEYAVVTDGGEYDIFEMPDADIQLRGMFTPDSDTGYVIEYYFQQPNTTGLDIDADYEIDDSKTEYPVGVTDSHVRAMRKDFTGYSFNEGYSTLEGTISADPDNPLVLKLYYDRSPKFSVEYEFTGYVPGGLVAPEKETDHIEGEEVTVAVIDDIPEGYTFSGWTSYGGAVQPEDESFVMPARDVHLSGSFIPDATTYKVVHHLQNLQRNGYDVEEESAPIDAVVDQEIVAAPNAYEGFSTNIALSQFNGKALPNDELVLNIYYDRIGYKVSYGYYGTQPENAPDVTAGDYAAVTKYYGEKVTVAIDPTLQNYSFNGWYSSQVNVLPETEEFVMPAKDVVLIGRFERKEASYVVKHIIVGEEVPYKIETITGPAGEEVKAEPISIDGYKHDTDNEDTLTQGIILEDGTLELKLYYYKVSGGGGNPGGGGGGTISYVLTYQSNGGTEYAKETYKAGTVVKLDKKPVKEGYIFDGWHLDKDLTEDAAEVKMTSPRIVYASWVEDNGSAGNGHVTPPSLNGDDHFAYVVGYPDGTVRPNDNITRAEVTSIFFRLLKAEIRDANLAEANSFNDIGEDMWYNTAISTMEKMGIVDGRYPGIFAADEFITRAEFAVICARFDDSGYEIVDSFTDVAGHWAEAEIHEAAAHGWIRGYEDNSFMPDQFITRAEAMTLINRVLNRVPESKDSLLDDMIKWPDNSDVNEWYYLAVQEATNSHEYDKVNSIYEKWTKMLTGTDWLAYEK